MKRHSIRDMTSDSKFRTLSQDETGWKYIHGDVFRFPRNISLFSAILGTGTQLLVLTFSVFGLALVGVFYPYNRGAMLTALVVLYALTAGIAGCASAQRAPAPSTLADRHLIVIAPPRAAFLIR